MKIRRIKKIFTIILLSVTLFALGCVTQTNTSPSSTTVTTASPAVRQTYTAPPAMQIDPSKNYTATVDTSLGTFKIQLFAAESPITANNFVFLSRQGFYNGIIFHRIMQDFMIQTGDPTGTGGGGPGYTIPDELPVKHKFDPGIVAMAKTNQPNSGGSQFFICTGTQAHGLDSPPYNVYTQFGQVIEGMDVVQKIAAVPVRLSAQGETSEPINPPVIKTITITEQ